ncbi:MAG: hypothetical protein ACP5J9_05260 [Dictyoglomus sp.]
MLHKTKSSLLIIPECGNPSIEVYYETVKNLAIKDFVPETKWFLCTNPICRVVYFSDKDIINKENKENIPVCYFVGITYKELS